MQPVYLDHAATTPLSPAARTALLPFLDGEFGNPSSRHPLGTRALAAVDEARARVARAFLVEPRQVVFTSGGTEAANLAVQGLARLARGRHVLVGALEHSCVRASVESLRASGFEVERLPLDSSGGLDLPRTAALLRPDTALVAQMLVHNETGAIAPIARLARLVRARSPKARLVVDAVQALGKLDCALPELGADVALASAHKLGGPKGAGALVLGPDVALEPLLHGGGQERGLRPGTENVAALVGFGVAAAEAERERVELQARFLGLRARFLAALSPLQGLRVLVPGGEVQPGIVALVVPGAPAEVRLHHLARRGVFVSAGSACQANSRSLSPGLLALGLSEDDVRCVLRVSFGRTTSESDVDCAAQALLEVSRELERAAS